MCVCGLSRAPVLRKPIFKQANMAEKAVTIRTRKFMTNRLLSRKQFVSFIFFLKIFPFSLLYSVFPSNSRLPNKILDLLGTTLFISMKKNNFGSDGLVGFCVLCDVMLFYCVIFLGMQTGTNGFVLLVSVFLCIILVFFFFFSFGFLLRDYI